MSHTTIQVQHAASMPSRAHTHTDAGQCVCVRVCARARLKYSKTARIVTKTGHTVVFLFKLPGTKIPSNYLFGLPTPFLQFDSLLHVSFAFRLGGEFVRGGRGKFALSSAVTGRLRRRRRRKENRWNACDPTAEKLSEAAASKCCARERL